ncbi:hypothetical protein Syun_013838 [Stephania yunnanensis]|uniref:Uncharacterized protein n=1 Tax=Stephania yunnanensis TaxID=152371 RepID=A0AAP0JJW8_9MAGN
MSSFPEEFWLSFCAMCLGSALLLPLSHALVLTGLLGVMRPSKPNFLYKGNLRLEIETLIEKMSPSLSDQTNRLVRNTFS